MYGKDFFSFGAPPDDALEVSTALQAILDEAAALEAKLQKEGDPPLDAQSKKVLLLVAKATYEQLVTATETIYKKYSKEASAKVSAMLQEANTKSAGDKAAYLQTMADNPNIYEWINLLVKMTTPLPPVEKPNNTWMWLVGGATLLYFINKK